MQRRVVITGIGLCAPLTFEQVVAGESGLVVPPDPGLAAVCRRAGMVPGDPRARVRALPGGWRPDRLDPVSWYALLATHAARADAGLEDDPHLEAAAVLVASAMGGEQTHHDASRRLTQHQLAGTRPRFSPFTAPKLMPNAASATAGMLLGAHGCNVSPAAACASGAYALAQALDLIRLERADLAFAGAAEAPCEEIAAHVFAAGDALSPTGESLPFHRRRNGFVMGEGAAVLVLEELDRARRRRARIYAELAGAGLTCDAYHVTAPQPEGTRAAAAMTAALREARLAPEDVGYVNAHATGTPVGDPVELRALRLAFGARVPPVSSTKGATGHLLGAAGALEAAYTVLALYHGRLPPTLGLRNDDGAEGTPVDDSATGFDLVPEPGRTAPIRAAISNSFAFGGHNACLAFRALDG